MAGHSPPGHLGARSREPQEGAFLWAGREHGPRHAGFRPVTLILDSGFRNGEKRNFHCSKPTSLW